MTIDADEFIRLYPCLAERLPADPLLQPTGNRYRKDKSFVVANFGRLSCFRPMKGQTRIIATPTVVNSQASPLWLRPACHLGRGAVWISSADHFGFHSIHDTS